MSKMAADSVSADMDGQRTGRAPSKGEARAASDDGIAVLSYVLTGIFFYGGLGYAGYRFLGQTWMLPVGLIFGMAASTYLIVKRYGSTK